MGRSEAVARQLIKESGIIDTKGQTDTIRLWENYRDQALLWRAIALLQIPATAIALLFTLVIWYNSEIILNVPAKPLPGVYAAQEIPDVEFINAANDYINLIATYQPAVVERQFTKAREMLREPMLTLFNQEMMDVELKAIKATTRTQVFFVDPSETTIVRDGKDVHVTLIGDRLKMVAGRDLPVVETKFVITMTTIPRNVLNPYGIVITNVTAEVTKS